MENFTLNFNNIIFNILIIAVLLDVFLGSIRAIRSKQWNSTVGINGILRKISMIGSCIFLILVDSILKIDLLFFVPKNILSIFRINRVGISELFGIIFILYEVTSILKNMVLCGLPIPNRLKRIVESALKQFTEELEIEGGDKNE